MTAFWISTASVAVGEIGDKTQLLSLLLATRLRRPAWIIAGIFAATVVNHLIACWVGTWASRFLTPHVLRWVLGFSFLAVAAWALTPDTLDENIQTKSRHGVFVLTTVTFFVAEMGDKTQLITLALAAKYNALLEVLIGATLGMMIVNIPTVIFAERVTKRVPTQIMRVVAAVIYFVLGVLTISGYTAVGL